MIFGAAAGGWGGGEGVGVAGGLGGLHVLRRRQACAQGPI